MYIGLHAQLHDRYMMMMMMVMVMTLMKLKFSQQI